MDGDFHIWQASNGDGAPIALCGHTPAVDVETGDVIPDEPTGGNCEECMTLGSVVTEPEE